MQRMSAIIRGCAHLPARSAGSRAACLSTTASADVAGTQPRAIPQIHQAGGVGGPTSARPAQLSGARVSRSPHMQAVVDEMLRVDHAGEVGAVQIYAGQMWVLRGTGSEKTLQHMKEGEEEHLRTLQRLMASRRVRPTLLVPLAEAAGFALGAATALLGKEAAMACTVAVETSISQHYNDQIRQLLAEKQKRGGRPEVVARGANAFPSSSSSHSSSSSPLAAGSEAEAEAEEARRRQDDELLAVFAKHRNEELEHHDTALGLGAERAPFYNALSAVIQAGCAAAIQVVRRI